MEEKMETACDSILGGSGGLKNYTYNPYKPYNDRPLLSPLTTYLLSPLTFQVETTEGSPPLCHELSGLMAELFTISLYILGP